MIVAKTPDIDSNATFRRNRRQLNPNPKEVKYSAGSILLDPPEASKDQPPVPAEKREALRSAQKSSFPGSVPGTNTRSGRRVNPLKKLGFD